MMVKRQQKYKWKNRDAHFAAIKSRHMIEKMILLGYNQAPVFPKLYPLTNHAVMGLRRFITESSIPGSGTVATRPGNAL